MQTPPERLACRRAPPRSARITAIAAVWLASQLLCMAAASAQPHSTASAAAMPAGPTGGPAWSTLTPAQRSVLAPLQGEWPQLPIDSKQKWVEIAQRYPSLPEAERSRIQARMVEWTRMSPQERTQARLRFQQARKLSPQERQARWEEYQAMPPEQRQRFASSPAARQELARRPEATRAKEPERERPQAKSNLVPLNPNPNGTKTVSPSVVQAKPGASTYLISRTPAPPPHQQAGLPKIATTPGLVDKSTLLPRRGPQGAGATPASAPKPAAAPASARRP